jgi:hypothetical protein
MRTSHIAILCSLIGLLLLSIAMNVLVCIQYSKQTDSAITELFFSKSDESLVDEEADSTDVSEEEESMEDSSEEGQE